MGASASLFRKGEYPTEKDLDIIIDIFTKMKFYGGGKENGMMTIINGIRLIIMIIL